MNYTGWKSVLALGTGWDPCNLILPVIHQNAFSLNRLFFSPHEGGHSIDNKFNYQEYTKLTKVQQDCNVFSFIQLKLTAPQTTHPLSILVYTQCAMKRSCIIRVSLTSTDLKTSHVPKHTIALGRN